ncbi:VOC family protein [Sinanaerobacter sp. ZZT-01]|uniref:VOC family protein n=1 Tax=Sinanaerobacter sp. ZZT-01 TaxID=3111540 RepID=UPI002D7A3A27|nr:VOC family protein [Sinanaerobacter sp. ZZT-01]WRR94921.1 VOC family protein [Sinanaerobacter sp. ZZT-01]
MKFALTHNCINVLDLERSMRFYEQALDMKEVRRLTDEEGNYILSFIANENATHQIELTWLKERTEPYNLGDNEIHMGLVTDDYEAALAKHKAMGVVCFENTKFGVYFIEDPDGYWIEIVPQR